MGDCILHFEKRSGPPGWEDSVGETTDVDIGVERSACCSVHQSMDVNQSNNRPDVKGDA